MHWRKNRLVGRKPKKEIVQTGACPDCGQSVKFYYAEGGQLCHQCKRERMRKEDRRL